MTDIKSSTIEFAARVVASYVGNHVISTEDLPALTGQIYAALARLLEEGAPPVKPEPVVPVSQSIKRDAIICLACGRGFKTLRRHLSVDHGLSPDDYRARYDLKRDYPLVAPAYAAARSEMAKRIGLGRKPGEKPRRRRAAR